jgi:hypothetical protein
MEDLVTRALLREREGYLRRGLSGRVAAVDAELARLGYRDAEPLERAVVEPITERAVIRRRRRR